ncbi:multidrug resistance-associated protein 1-like [Mytilus californianus]|uniref:multidrug resistance-associated protein 1-like n=1 Tax=Mytilus californianus TaxID=6549 RepID=UPI002246C552|nr:multidrug resistance-associated protein 1-like [Mytilus californianus]
MDSAYLSLFEKSLLQSSPCFLLLLGAPLRVFHFGWRNSPKRINTLGTILTVLIAVLTLGVLALNIHGFLAGDPSLTELFPVLVIITMALEAYLSRTKKISRPRSKLSSLLLLMLFLSVFLRLCFSSLHVGVTFRNGTYDFLQSSILLLYCVLVLIRLVESLFYNSNIVDSSSGNQVPEDDFSKTDISVLSSLTFSWVEPLFRKGRDNSLKLTDLPPFAPSSTTKTCMANFEKYWTKEVTRAHSEKKDKHLDKTKIPKARLLTCICKASGPQLLLSALNKLITHGTDIAHPFTLTLLLACISSESPEETQKGYMYAFCIFGIELIRIFAVMHHIHMTQEAGRKNELALTVAIYKKILRLSNTSRKSSTVGEIINLLSVDAGKIGACMWSINDVWAVPLVFCTCFYITWRTLGNAVVIGVGALVVLMPIFSIFIKKSHAFHVLKKSFTDARIKMMNEILNGIRVMKMYAWEESFMQRITEIRDKELNMRQKTKRMETFQHALSSSTPFMISFCTFGSYVFLYPNDAMSAEKIFLFTWMFRNLHWALHAVTHTINNFNQAYVSYQRIENFLNNEEIDDDFITRSKETKYGITLNDGNFKWDKTAETILKDINLKIPEGSLIAVVGSVGSGKSSFLTSLLGEMETDTANINVKGSVAYVAQQAWIMNATLQDNVLFGDKLKQKTYEQIIDATSLRKDLEMFAAGDQTEIGEKGINLSGGQKQRVSLARALYKDADIYLLDDPLSAVDSHVGKHIFDSVIGPSGILKDKTRILVTHGLSFLRNMDMIITLVDGKVGEIGSFTELIGHDGAFAKFLKIYMIEELTCGEPEEEQEALALTEEVASELERSGSSSVLMRQLSEIAQLKRMESSEDESYKSRPSLLSRHSERPTLLRRHSEIYKKTIEYGLENETVEKFVLKKNFLRQQSADIHSTTKYLNSSLHEKLHHTSNQHLQWLEDRNIYNPDPLDDIINDICVEDESEHSIMNRQSSRCLSRQASKCIITNDNEKCTKATLIEDETIESGTVKVSVIMSYVRAIGIKLCIIALAFNMAHYVAEIYLDVWLSKITDDASSDEKDRPSIKMRVGVYGAIGLIRGILILITEQLVEIAMINGARKLHTSLLNNVLMSPMSFFDSTPLGRIINRFSKDIESIDEDIVFMFKDVVVSGFYFIMSVMAMCSGTPHMILVVVPISMAFWYIQQTTVPTRRQLQRLSSAARSPIYSHMGETISGCSTIRAYQQESRFIQELINRCDDYSNCINLIWSTGKWTHIRNDFLGAIVVFCACMFSLIGKDHLTVGIVALTFTYAYKMKDLIRWFMMNYANFETNIVSIERVTEFIETPKEALWRIQETKPKPTWPDEGRVEMNDYGVRYREDLDLVLKGITSKILPCEKIGIVGRTGAGKSSLTMALFRILEPAQGNIIIDGVDISTIGLHDLRSKITIIPQDPVLFCGSIRMNLDPFDVFSTENIWRALEHAHLKDFVQGLEDGMDHQCSEGGENLSVGQRQLVCLARALLRKTKILVLDEATAAVDLKTDELIQNTIRTEFADCTVLTIAHRLNTIMDYTRVMVLETGRIKEFDSPTNLLQNKDSVFYSMAKNAGLVK